VAQTQRSGSLLPRQLRTGGAALLTGLPGLVPTFAVVALLACVLVPLPTALVDLLLSVSLAGSVLLLVASLGVRRSAEFLGFPALLLLVTLYRLAINVSTTRLILSQADAGLVVDAFASFVVRGDLVVGGVMFAIISVIQYLVIARGSERVAEVAARFALDGLPGHQHAIEADLRAGLLSPAEAARRRAGLVERSGFYGAMDGAIRFVKGDAVAGLVIIAINLAGGMAIGMGRLGLTWSQSLELFGRLTIGDGLLTQIPALLVSLAAGVLVSRVDQSSAEPRSALPWLDPAMLLVPATLLLLLALLPSMPGLAFITTATALLTGALWLATRRGAARPSADDAPPSMQLSLHPAVVDDLRGLERALTELRARCHDALGVELPPLQVRSDPAAPSDRWELRRGERLLLRAHSPGPARIDEVLLSVFRAVMDHAPSLVDLQELEDQLEQLRGTHPVLVRRALEAVEPADLLVIVRAFLAERLRLPPLPRILAVIAEDRRFRQSTERPRYAELTRMQLAASWVPEVLDGIQRLGRPRFVRLTPDAEEALMERAVEGEGGLVLRMSDAERARWLEVLRAEPEPDEPLDSADPDPFDPDPAQRSRASADTVGPRVVITSPRVRPAAAALLAGVVPHVPVLSTTELQRSRVAGPRRVHRIDPP